MGTSDSLGCGWGTQTLGFHKCTTLYAFLWISALYPLSCSLPLLLFCWSWINSRKHIDFEVAVSAIWFRRGDGGRVIWRLEGSQTMFWSQGHDAPYMRVCVRVLFLDEITAQLYAHIQHTTFNASIIRCALACSESISVYRMRLKHHNAYWWY